MAFNEKLRITLEADASNLIKGLDATRTELDDSASAADQVAAAIEDMAGRLESELDQAASAAGHLADALGPETVSALKAQGQSIDDVVAALRQAGLTYNDIEGDTDALAASLKHLTSVGDKIDTHLTKNMEGVRRETDQSRSVMANFAGNAMQEVPGIAGAFGPLNMAVSQFTEYASEGGIQLKNMAGMGAGIGVVSLAMWGLAQRSKAVAEVKAFQTESITSYAEALKKADSRTAAIAAHLREVGKIEYAMGANSGWWTGGVTAKVDLTKVYNALGVTAAAAADLIAGGKPKIEAWGAALVASGTDANAVTVAVQGLEQQLAFVDAAARNNATTVQFLGSTHKAVSEQVESTVQKLRKSEDRLATHATQTDLTADAAARLAATQEWQAKQTDKARIATDRETRAMRGLFDEISRDEAFQQWNLDLEALPAKLKQIEIDGKKAGDSQQTWMREQALAIDQVQSEIGAYARDIEGLPASVVTAITAQVNGATDVLAVQKAMNSLANMSPQSFNLNMDNAIRIGIAPAVVHVHLDMNGHTMQTIAVEINKLQRGVR